MYGHTSQPSSDADDYEIGKVAIHCSFIVARFSTYVYQRGRFPGTDHGDLILRRHGVRGLFVTCQHFGHERAR
jgi:hypothetical protein